MRIVCVSDLHGALPRIPECDLLLIAGDICPIDWIEENPDTQLVWLDHLFRDWLRRVPAKLIIGIGGNHDFALETPEFDLLRLPWRYLRDSETVYEGLRIYGIPYVARLAAGKPNQMRRLISKLRATSGTQTTCEPNPDPSADPTPKMAAGRGYRFPSGTVERGPDPTLSAKTVAAAGRGYKILPGRQQRRKLVPVCLPCWRQQVSMTADPPRRDHRLMEECSVCGRDTNHGTYVPELFADQMQVSRMLD